jgi:hypothetical protein
MKTGVAGMKAFFARHIENQAESAAGTMTNEQKVCECVHLFA